MVEASWHDEVAPIYRAWEDYLLNEPGRLWPNPQWSSDEQDAWFAYDLTAGLAYHGAPATVVDIRPAAPESEEYVVKTLFARTDPEMGHARPVALTRVYAAREGGRWVFGNAIHRLTSDWERTRIGPIEYVTPPGQPPDRTRAERLLSFADSIAVEFNVPQLDELTYYVAESPEDLHRIMGVDWTFGGLGHGYAILANQLLLSGDPAFGDENRHELVHILLEPILAEGQAHGLVWEGVATWYGGSSGRSFDELVEEYSSYLSERPGLTLDTILDDNVPDRGWNVAGAVLVDLVFEDGGIERVQELLRSGRSNSDLRRAASRILGLPWDEVVARWRERILRNGD